MLLFSLFVTSACFRCACDAFSVTEPPPSGEGVGRREVVRKAFLGLSGGLLFAGPSNAVASAADASTETRQKVSSSFFSYRIVPDASPGPDLSPD